MKTMNDLMLRFVRDMYYAEQQTLRSLPEWMAAIHSDALRRVVDLQLQATRAQLQGLDAVFSALGKPAEGATCEALLGLITETEDLLKETGSPGPLQDAGLIAHLQAVQHYAIARYGALLGWAGETGQERVVATLRQMLDAAKATNEELNRVAEGSAAKAAESA